ncbi:aminotransferase class III-fold pyridoxal phosphate-dependent enzyme [Sorangium sp. So ce1128]
MSRSSSYERSRSLYLAARRLIPGGGHRSGAPLLDPEPSPMYFERGKGCRIWDVDGHEYIDFIMAYGAFLLGYAEETVDRAAMEQAARGNLLSMNHPLRLRFVEALLRRFPAADMAIFAKTGSEATTAALRVARRFTGRRKVVRCGYHGWHDWCVPEDDSVPAGLAEQVLALRDVAPESLSALLTRSAGEIAAVILAPEMVLPLTRDAVASMIDAAHRHGALFILDEVKTGFRTRAGSVQQYLGVEPDLTTLSKALGNGWPISAVLGKREVMQAGEGLPLSATYHGETAAMAAALMTLEIIDREPVQDHVWHLGERLIDGLNTLVARHRLPARAYAEPIPPMPFLAFTHPDDSVNDRLRTTFYGEMFKRGVLFHPRHLWYIAHAHTTADIEGALGAADEAMGITRARVSLV